MGKTTHLLSTPAPVSSLRWRQALAKQQRWWLDERSDAKRRAPRPWRPPVEVVSSYFDVAPDPKNRILEVGCADGARYRHFPQQRYTGIDPLLPLPGTRGIRGTLLGGIGEQLPFRDDSFDAVIFVETLDHVRDPTLCLMEALRVLSPGGNLWVFSRNSMEPIPSGAKGCFSVSEEDIHLHVITGDFIQALLQDHFRRYDFFRDSGYFAFHGRDSR